MPRNPRPAWRGIGGRHAAESMAGIGRNTQLSPWHHLVHLREKHIAPGSLSVDFEPCRRQTLLRGFHLLFSPAFVRRILCDSVNKSEIP